MDDPSKRVDPSAELRAVWSLHDRHRIAQSEAELRREQLLTDLPCDEDLWQAGACVVPPGVIMLRVAPG